jgi:hypothetical protein
MEGLAPTTRVLSLECLVRQQRDLAGVEVVILRVDPMDYRLPGIEIVAVVEMVTPIVQVLLEA